MKGAFVMFPCPRHFAFFICGALLLALNTGVARGEKPLTDYPPAAQALYKQAQQLFEQARFREALEARGEPRLAAADQARAEELDKQARALKERPSARADGAKPPGAGPGRPAVAETRDSARPGARTGPIALVNNYVEPVTIRINDK